MVMHAYVAGKMTDVPGHNFDAFDECAQWLRSKGWRVTSPAEEDRKLGFDGSETEVPFEFTSAGAMKRDLHIITDPDVDAIVLLPEWVSSPGARQEAKTAIACLTDLYLYEPKGIYETEGFNDEKRLVNISPEVAEHMMNEYGAPDGIVISSTGGRKGKKDIRYSLIPSESLEEVALCYGIGAKKYGDWNWALGYDISLSIDALERHLHAWKRGEEDDEEGFKHMAAVVFHALTIIYRDKFQREWDDYHR